MLQHVVSPLWVMKNAPSISGALPTKCCLTMKNIAFLCNILQKMTVFVDISQGRDCWDLALIP